MAIITVYSLEYTLLEADNNISNGNETPRVQISLP